MIKPDIVFRFPPIVRWKPAILLGVAVFLVAQTCVVFAQGSGTAKAEAPIRFVPGGVAVRLTPEEKAWLATNATARVGAESDWAPFDFTVEGKPTGYSNDLLRLAAEKVGLKLKFVTALPWTELMRKFRKGELEILPALWRTPERDSFVHFTPPYLANIMAIASRGDNVIRSVEELRGRKVALIKEYATAQELLQTVPSVQPVFFEDFLSALLSVQREETDAFFGTEAVIQFTLRDHFIANFNITGVPNFGQSDTTNLHMGVRKELPVLGSLLVKGLRAITQVEQLALKNRWFGGVSVARAQNGSAIGLEPSEREWLLEHPVIRVGVDPAYAPFEFVDDAGRYRGISADFLSLIEAQLGIDFQVVPNLRWEEVVEKARRREIDLLPAATITEERRKFLSFTKPYMPFPLVLVSRKGQTQFNSLPDLAGAQVAVVKGYGTARDAVLAVPEVKPVLFETPLQAMEAVASGNVDAMAINLAVASHIIETNHLLNLRVSNSIGVGRQGLHLAVRSDWPELRGILEKALAAISQDSKRKIQRRWVTIAPAEAESNNQVVELTEEEQAWIQQHSKIRLGVDPDFVPFEFIGKEGNYEGMAADYVALLNRKFGIEMQIVPGLKWSEVIAKAMAGEIDLLPAVGISEERKRFLQFSEPYMTFTRVIVTRDDAPFISGLDDLTGLNVAVQADTSHHGFLKENTTISPLLLGSPLEPLLAVAQGKADAAVGNVAVIAYLIRKHKLTKLKIAAPASFEQHTLHFAVRKDWPELTAIINKGLASITNEEHEAIRQRWIGLGVEPQIDYSLIWKLTTVLSGLMALVLFWTWQVRRQKAAVEKSENRLRSIIQTATDGIIATDALGIIQAFSPAAEKIFGYDELEIIGSNVADLMMEDSTGEPESARIGTGNFYGLERESQGVRKDKTVFPLELSVGQTMIGDEPILIGIVRDITERHHSRQLLLEKEHQLLQKTELLETVLNNLQQGLVAYDKNLRIIACNQQFVELRNVPEHLAREGALFEDLMRHDIEQGEFGLGDPEVLLTEKMATARIDERHHFERTRPDGTILEIQGGTLPGGGFVSTYSDITERKAFEEELVRMRREAEAATRAKSEFLANMSHEIRTPMNGVIGMLELMTNTPLSEDQKFYISTALSSAGMQLNIINDILDFSKVEAGMLVLESIPFDLGVVVEETAALLSEGAYAKNVEFTCFIESEKPLSVYGDPTRLRQVVANLVNNAIKFTAAGEVRVRISVLKETSDHIRISCAVEDTGIGIAENQIGKLFHSFSQADSSTTRKYGGTGLGLAISHTIVEMMGGRFDVESILGKGSTFRFSVEFKKAKPASSSDSVLPPGLRVLVVDDNKTNRTIVEHYLLPFGAQVAQAIGGREALALLTEATERGSPMQVAILDLHMPEIDGIELARIIKDSAAIAQPRILMLSSSHPTDTASIKDAGIEMRLTKPVRQAQLIETLSSLLSERPVGLVTGPVKKKPLRLSGKVLLAEDTYINQQVALGLLAGLGLEADVVGNGKEAVARVAEQDYKIVLMDIQMPEMDGFDATVQIREWEHAEKRPRIPIIAMTAHALAGDREKCLAAGMDDYIAKPVRQNEFEDKLAYWIERKEHGLEHKVDSPVSIPPAETEDELLDFGVLDRLGIALKNDPEALPRILKHFLADTPVRIGEIRKACREGDPELLHLPAHSLKSNCATIGAKNLSKMFRKIEALGMEGVTEGAADLLEQAEAEFSQVRDAVESYLT